MKRVYVVLATAAAVLIAAGCEPPPPAKVCDFVTAEQFASVQDGWTRPQVEAALGKPLTLTYTYSYEQYDGTTVTYETWEWNQDYDANGCYQNVSFDFEDGVLTGSSWGKVIK